ncbi:MAG: GNAT family N-acetyltransferase [Clostridia bacterium]|jgi:ribosomal protein S18 acetylase RimI-like enzyme|nr:GNAT family N-acetyltransferase [Clostridia bacterium]
MSEVEIMEPKIEDQAEIDNLAKQVHKLHVNWNPDIFLDVEQVIPIERLNKLLEAKSIYVAKKENKIIGYIIINITEKDNGFMRYRKLLDIDTLCIDEEYRGLGIGTKMLNFAKEFGKNNGCTDMHLTVNPQNTNAIRVYEKFGMEVDKIAYMMKL